MCRCQPWGHLHCPMPAAGLAVAALGPRSPTLPAVQARSFYSYPDFLHNTSRIQRGSRQRLSTAAVPGWALGWPLGEQPRAHTQAQGHKRQLSVLWE